MPLAGSQQAVHWQSFIMKELEMEIMHPNLFACTSTTPCPRTFFVTIILEAFKLKSFILKLDEADGDIFCSRNFYKSCIQIFALKLWKKFVLVV
jgi:hypothetical protein